MAGTCNPSTAKWKRDGRDLKVILSDKASLRHGSLYALKSPLAGWEVAGRGAMEREVKAAS